MAFNPDEYLAKKSDFDPDAYLAKKDQSRNVSMAPAIEVVESQAPGLLGRLTGKALETVGKVGQAIDPYTGAPARAMYGATQETPIEYRFMPSQFGRTAVRAGKGLIGYLQGEKAPTEAELLQKDFPKFAESEFANKPLSEYEALKPLYSETGEGLPLKKGGLFDITPKGVAETGYGIALDITNIIPSGSISKVASATNKAAKGLKETKTVGSAIDKIAAFQAKVGHALTGVDENAVKTYLKKNKQVEELIAKYGGDTQTAADAVRESFQTQLRNARGNISKQIGESLEKKGDQIVNIKDVLDDLDLQSSKLNKATKKADISQVKELKETLSELADENGDILLRDLHDAKEFAQDRAKSAYVRGGQIFAPGKDSQKISKQTAALLRKRLNSAAPDIAEFNNKLALIHGAEDGLIKNLIKPGGPEGSLITAGGKTISRPRKQLERLEKTSGVPMVEKAEQLSAARTFADPSLLPVDVTGKSMTRLALGGGAGLLAGGQIGAAVGSALTSPWALKYGIKTELGIIDLAKKLGKPVEWLSDPKNADKVESFLRGTEKGARISRPKEESKGLLKNKSGQINE